MPPRETSLIIAIPIGTPVTGRASYKPSMRRRRTWLPIQVFDDEALLRIRVLGPGGRQPTRCDWRHSGPGHVAVLATTPERPLLCKVANRTEDMLTGELVGAA